jgi:hypothetical protein
MGRHFMTLAAFLMESQPGAVTLDVDVLCARSRLHMPGMIGNNRNAAGIDDSRFARLAGFGP